MPCLLSTSLAVLLIKADAESACGRTLGLQQFHMHVHFNFTVYKYYDSCGIGDIPHKYYKESDKAMACWCFGLQSNCQFHGD